MRLEQSKGGNLFLSSSLQWLKSVRPILSMEKHLPLHAKNIWRQKILNFVYTFYLMLRLLVSVLFVYGGYTLIIFMRKMYDMDDYKAFSTALFKAFSPWMLAYLALTVSVFLNWKMSGSL